MNKSELITAVSDATGMTRADAARALHAVLGTVSDRLARGESVALTGFGTFDRTDLAARAGRNPRTGEAIQIPARKGVRFRAGRPRDDAVQER